MTEAEFRLRVREYAAAIPADRPTRLFTWSARLLTPLVTGDGEITRECFGTVGARTWVEAACKVALRHLSLAPDLWFTDVILRYRDGAARAWDRKGPTTVFDSPDPAHHDEEEVQCQSSSAG